MKISMEKSELKRHQKIIKESKRKIIICKMLECKLRGSKNRNGYCKKHFEEYKKIRGEYRKDAKNS